MPNQYVNKVNLADGTTLIDITGTTATADKILQGYGAYGADGAWMDGTAVAGSGSAVTVVDTPDSHGGTIRTITAVSLAGDTVSAAHLERGYTAHDALGNPVTGTLNPGGGTVNLQTKDDIDPTESSQTITADTGYDGLESVQINAMPSGSAATPATTITANPTISVNSSTGLITASNSKTQSVTPTVSAGYVSSGTAGTITVSGSNTSQLTTQAAQTIHPSTSDQTIASGRYLTGAQTVKAVTTTNLTAANILSGVTVKVGDSTDDDCVASVSGSVVIQHYYTGSSAPSSSLGVNGDIYLQTT